MSTIDIEIQEDMLIDMEILITVDLAQVAVAKCPPFTSTYGNF